MILKNLASRITPKEGEHIIPVVNIMDGKGIAAKIDTVVTEFFPGAKG